MPRKRKSIIFVSYAKSDRKDAMDLVKRFSVQTNISKNYEHTLWSDGDILVGNDWHSSIQKALRECKIGLLLVSPDFLGSEYIENNELKMFAGKNAKPSVPVLMQPVVFGHQNLKGLQKRQFFQFEHDNSFEIKAYAHCRGKNQKNEYAQQLFKWVEKVLDNLYIMKKRQPKSKKKTSTQTKASRRKKAGP